VADPIADGEMDGRNAVDSEPSTSKRPGAAPEPQMGRAIYELFIFALTIFSLLTLTAYFLLPLSPATKEAIFQSDFVISLIFLADFVRSLVRAANRKAYLKWGWLDLLGSIPAVLPLRFLRVFRLIRAWRTIRTSNPRRVLREFRARRADSTLLISILVAVMVLTLSSVMVLELESGQPGANIQTGADVSWWAIVSLSTVGYGDKYPVTPGGRLVGVVLIVVGVGLFGVITSYLATVFIGSDRKQGRRREGRSQGAASSPALEPLSQPDLAALRADIAALEGQLEAMRADLQDLAMAVRERDQ